MIDTNSLLHPGKVIKLVNSKDDAWELGINKLLGERAIICDLLLDPEGKPAVEENSDFKLAISRGSGVYLIPVCIEYVAADETKYKCLLSEEYEFVQRREYYRLMNPDLQINCKIYGEYYEPKALDLAGGGIGLFMERERSIKQDTLMELRIEFPDGNTVEISARAAHIVPAEEPNTYYVGAYFSKIARADEAKIMKFIFCEQIRKSKEKQENTKDSPRV